MLTPKKYTIKVTEGNAFGLLLLLKERAFEGTTPTDTDIDATQLEDVVIKINDTETTDFSLGTDGVLVSIPSTQAKGMYNVVLTATYDAQPIRAAYFECFQIVDWSYQSNAELYIPDSPIESEAAYVISGYLDDTELAALKAEYIEKIQAAEQAAEDAQEAKEEWEEKAAALDDVATETNATANKEEILDAIDGISIDTSTIAKQGSNTSATLTDTQAYALAAKTAAEGITIPTDYALQGSDTTATNTAILSAIGNISIDTTDLAKQGTDSTATLTATQTAAEAAQTAAEAISGYALQGSDTTATNTAILTAVNNISGGGGTVYPTIQMTAASTDIDPNKVYIWGEMSAITITALNAGEAGVANVYFLEFYSGATPTTLTLPASVTDIRGSIASNVIINVAILNGVAYIA